MKKQLYVLIVILTLVFLFIVINNTSTNSTVADDSLNDSTSKYSLIFEFKGPQVSPPVAYACWIENESGQNIQNIYICNGVVDIGKSLLGDDLPYWKTVKYSSDIDGVTGASVQNKLSVTRNLNTALNKRFRVCFEIDRSTNGNTYFYDRPSFVYMSDLIDLDNLKASYALSLIGWMANSNAAPQKYSQQPKSITDIPGFKQYKLMDNLTYIENLDDMVTSLIAHIDVAPDCIDDFDCNDDLFCNGEETCSSGECADGIEPCDGQSETCNEDTNQCDVAPACIDDLDCDDGLFCNGAEECVAGDCISGVDPCDESETCKEVSDLCVPEGCDAEWDLDGDCHVDKEDARFLKVQQKKEKIVLKVQHKEEKEAIKAAIGFSGDYEEEWDLNDDGNVDKEDAKMLKLGQKDEKAEMKDRHKDEKAGIKAAM